MGTVAADAVDGHEDADDDSESAEDKERHGESDLYEWSLVVPCVRGFHHHVLICNRKRVVYVRHFFSFFLLVLQID